MFLDFLPSLDDRRLQIKTNNHQDPFYSIWEGNGKFRENIFRFLEVESISRFGKT
jgi:hypothetical protein